MKLLHTSDWHLGRSFHRVGLMAAQEAFLDHLVDVVRSERVDVVLVAGDVYDRALPAVDVVALLDDALARLVGAGAHVVLTGGNHDSPARLSFAARLLEAAKVHIRCDARRCGEPVLLGDEHGPVAIYPLPYLEPSVAAGQLGCPPGHVETVGAALAAVRADLAGRSASGRVRSVVSAHAFVVGGLACESERDITVGGVASVPSSLFDGFDYVALGHLHRPQEVTGVRGPDGASPGAARYSGSPLAYSFSEHGQVKGSCLVTLGARGVEAVETVVAPVPRPLALLRGSLTELLTRGDLAVHEGAWCQVTLTDAARPAQAMEQVRRRFPHTVELRFDPMGVTAPPQVGYAERVRGRSDAEICAAFLQHVRRRPADRQELAWIAEALTAVRVADLELPRLDRARADRGAGEVGVDAVVVEVREVAG